MNIKYLLFSAALLLPVATGLGAEPKRVSISGYDTMKYSVTTIDASPGQQVIVELKNEGSLPKDAMGHNWILLKAGIDPASYAKAAANAKAENYEPKALSSKVLAIIPLLGPKERAVTSFTAPKAPGNYYYLCSFPGHEAAGMKGTLVVK
jgi:azurin